MSYVNKITLVISECWSIIAVVMTLYPLVKPYYDDQSTSMISPSVKVIMHDSEFTHSTSSPVAILKYRTKALLSFL